MQSDTLRQRNSFANKIQSSTVALQLTSYALLPKHVRGALENSFYKIGAHYLCSTRQWLDEGWIDGGYSPNKVWIYMLFIHSTYVRYPHFTNAYALSTHHLGIPILYLPIICACPPHLG